MSRSGFSLLVGWLTEGIGGEALGAGDGFTGERGKRGRATVMRVVNNHLRFDGNSQIQVLLKCPMYSQAIQSPRQIQLLSLLTRGRRLPVSSHP